MVDDLRSDDSLGGHDRTPRRAQRSIPEHPLTDREVPLDSQDHDARMLTHNVHAWLDGELPEASARYDEATRDVEFWRQINSEAERRRRMRTPTYLQAQIMEALPPSAPKVIDPWWRREFVVTPARAVGMASALVLLAALVTAGVLFAAR